MSPRISYQEVAECRMSADLHAIRLALNKMGEYYRIRGLPPVLWGELELAVAEGLNNAIEHGCANRAEAEVLVRWGWMGEMAWVEVTDPSDFLPESAIQAKLPEDVLAEGGRGAFLMARLTDRLEHRRTSGGHCLAMEKKVGPSLWKAEDVAELEMTVQSMAEDLSHSYEDLSALFRFAEELATSTTLTEFLDRSLCRLLSLVSGKEAYVRFLSNGGSSLRLIRTTGATLDWVEDRLSLETKGIEVESFTGGGAITVEDCSTLSAEDPLKSHCGGAFVCPVFFQTNALGCLVVTRSSESDYFSAGELGLIRVVADFLGIVRTTNSLQEQRQEQQRALRELEIASAIQQSLLPRKFPDNTEYSIFGVCQSAQEVGGDYFDALALEGGGILLVIADVMGKGVPAALLATILRTAIHARLDVARNPGQLLTQVNHQIASDLARIDMFITAQVAYLSPSDNVLLVSTAGHCPLIHCQSATKEIRQLHGTGIPLGVMDSFEYETESFTVEFGDRLVFLTDGLYEVEDGRGAMLGIEGLAAQIGTFREHAPMDFCGRILDFVRTYSGRKAPSDDRTLLTIDRIL